MLELFKTAILNLGYAYPWGYASSLQGVRQILTEIKISKIPNNSNISFISNDLN
jgi:hypothetical protein